MGFAFWQAAARRMGEFLFVIAIALALIAELIGIYPIVWLLFTLALLAFFTGLFAMMVLTYAQRGQVIRVSYVQIGLLAVMVVGILYHWRNYDAVLATTVYVALSILLVVVVGATITFLSRRS